jgi:hypothetical protein
MNENQNGNGNEVEVYVVTFVRDNSNDYEETEIMGVFTELELARTFIEGLETFGGWYNENRMVTNYRNNRYQGLIMHRIVRQVLNRPMVN